MSVRPAARPASALVARTVPLDGGADVDLLGVAGDRGLLFTREGAGLAARGTALRIEMPDGIGAPGAAERVRDELAAIAEADEVGRPGCGALALGALPFDPSAPAALVVPALVVGRSADGTAWVTSIGDGSDPRPHLEARIAPSPASRPPDGFNLTSQVPHDRWCEIIEEAVEQIRAGRFEKVVLARQVDVMANRPILVADVLERLRTLYPSTTVFSVEGFIGASPERLVRRTGSVVQSHPLAGTVAHSGDPEVDAQLAASLLASAKDRHEHRVVIEFVRAALGPVCEELHVPDVPSIVPLRNVSHLGTRIEGRLASPPPTALELCARMHPTPAVAGTPTEAAIEYIAAVEGFPRDRYAGAVGWVDGRGDGEFVVGIRCAQLDGPHARLYAGVGVVADSSPEAELAETQLKLQALLAAVVRP